MYCLVGFRERIILLDYDSIFVCLFVVFLRELGMQMAFPTYVPFEVLQTYFEIIELLALFNVMFTFLWHS